MFVLSSSIKGEKELERANAERAAHPLESLRCCYRLPILHCRFIVQGSRHRTSSDRESTDSDSSSSCSIYRWFRGLLLAEFALFVALFALFRLRSIVHGSFKRLRDGRKVVQIRGSRASVVGKVGRRGKRKQFSTTAPILDSQVCTCV
ncbi:hypothetical protein GQ54DRAFT_140876 [Martensiomyces pterosporus]|nr:hypothetical protein GQ54DRAFT_140876 [Martensiomyces pterosporus]